MQITNSDSAAPATPVTLTRSPESSAQDVRQEQVVEPETYTMTAQRSSPRPPLALDAAITVLLMLVAALISKKLL